MKIIISHDVDHLFNTDHIFRDLIFPKLIVRSGIELVKGKITISTFLYRCISVFEKRRNRIDEVMEKDKAEGIPSVFFFGMNQGLGMSYKVPEAIETIKKVKEKGFSCGVHGIEYQNIPEIKREHDTFAEVSGVDKFGIRTHYVRFDQKTFEKFSKTGYLYDTSEFNKNKTEIKRPYKVGRMWEFPLHIMDGYVIPCGDLEAAKNNTIAIINKAEELGMPYCTILFHDYLYNEKTYPIEKAWYDWLVDYLNRRNYEYTSYEAAISELENI